MRFTREPAAYGALVVAIVSLAAVFDFPFLQGDQSTAIIALVDAVVGLAVAAMVRPFAPSAVTYVILALATVAGTYGLHFHEDKVAAFNVAIVGLIFAITRLQQSPKRDSGGTPDQVVSTKP